MRYKHKFYCKKCLTVFLMFGSYTSTFTPNCVHCNANSSNVDNMGTVCEDVYEVSYSWEVRAYSHDEALEKAKKRGLKDWDGQGSRRMPMEQRWISMKM
jgi:hypothetical protein